MPEEFVVSGTLMASAPSRRAASESTAGALDRRSFWAVFGLLGLLACVLLLAPTLVVIVTSFTSGYSLKVPPPGYSSRWYQALWNDSPELIDAFLLSLKLAAIATAASIVLAARWRIRK